MGVSLYYELKRSALLTEKENSGIADIINRYNESFELKDKGEDFCVYDYDESEPEIIFRGATKLPYTENPDDMIDACMHWVECLSEIRLVIQGGSWSLNLDDMELLWDEDSGFWQLPE